jgi:CubicO group peptidase (beta-lactamase class C family)
MALERRAIFALSIAFTASIVAYPDLPPDIPPRAGREGAFVGAPFIAFLLPTAAIAIWWIVGSLRRRASGAARSIDAGAATAVFLSAFHVIMLIGFIGGHPWSGRILAIIVGLTLIWAGASLFLSRQKPAVIGLLLVCCCGVGGRAEAQDTPRERIESLPAFIDEAIPKLMEQGHVPGAAVVVVHDGRVVMLRGYGWSRLEDRVSVDPSRTLFRIGSVSKVLTSVGALQLAEAGALDLHRDIRAYLPEIPLRYGATTHHLLTHTAGLDERFGAPSTTAPHLLVSLTDRLRADPPVQVIRPGTAYSYSNSNFELAGLVIERVSGRPYEEYLADKIFTPLRMAGTTAREPPERDLLKDLARGYRWTGGSQEAVPYGFKVRTSPSGGISTTAADMGRFMLALLGDGSVDDGRILSREFVEKLLAPQYTPDPRIPPRGYAFLHWPTRGRRLQHHDGTAGAQIAVLVLAPAERFGIFVASNGAPGGHNNSIGNLILDPLLTRLLGPAARAPAPPPSAPGPDAIRAARRVAGTYRHYRQTRNDMTWLLAIMPMMQSRVTVDDDGAIRWKGHRWVEVEPLVFRSTDPPDYSADGADYIVFRENDRGAIAELHAWGATYERISWMEQAPFHLGLFACCVVTFVAYASSRGLRRLRGRTRVDEGRAARRSALFVSLVNITFVIGLPVFLAALRASVPLPAPVLTLWLALPFVSVAVTALLPGFAVMAWREGWWTRGERVSFSTFSTLAVAFMAFLNYWNLLTMP